MLLLLLASINAWHTAMQRYGPKADFDACGHWQNTNAVVFREHECGPTHRTRSAFSGGLLGPEVVHHSAALQPVEEEEIPVRSVSLRQSLSNTRKQMRTCPHLQKRADVEF